MNRLQMSPGSVSSSILSHGRMRIRWLVGALVILLMMEFPLWAGSGLLIVKPSRGVRPVSKLQMFLDTSWIVGPGMRQVKVVFRPIRSRTFPADRRLKVEIAPAVWGSYVGTRLVASREILLSEGAGSAEQFILLPQESDYMGYRVKVYENGRMLRDLSERDGVMVTNPTWNYGDQGDVSMAVIDKDVPSVFSRRTPSGGIQFIDQSNDVPDVANAAWMSWSRYTAAQLPKANARWTDVVQSAPSVEFFHPEDLSTALAGWSAFDLLVIEQEELRSLKANHRDRFDVLRRWLFAGGNLITTNAGDQFADRTEIEDLLELSRDELVAATTYPPRQSVWSGWRRAGKGGFGRMTGRLREALQSNGSLDEVEQQLRDVPAESPFLIRAVGFGQLVALAGGTDQSILDWNWLIRSFPGDASDWESRHGLSLMGANDGFWDFLIPGVGLPPVLAFAVLISLFVALIGPLNYFLLSRTRRLIWLTFTVPLGALLTIAGLVTFALSTDGFSTRARVRSVTHIDQRIGLASSWSRQAYYAGLARAEGLEFSDQTQVQMMNHVPIVSPGGVASSRRVFEQVGDKLRYRVGYFPSRTTMQYMIVQCSETNHRLEIETNGDQLQVSNQLGEVIRYLLVQHDDGTLYVRSDQQVSDGIWSPWADGSTEQLQATDRERQVAILSRVLADTRLETPPGFDRSLIRDQMFGGRGGWATNRRNDMGILEQRIRSVSDLDVKYWGPRTFVAVVDQCGEVPLGVDKAEITSSLYLITGTY